MSKLYRTNSYTGRQDPFSTPWYALAHDINDNESTFRILSVLSRLFEENRVPIHMTQTVSVEQENVDILNNMSVGERENFYRDCFSILSWHSLFDWNNAITCWFSSNQQSVLSRSNGYGQNLCKENQGVVRYFSKDDDIVLYSKGFDLLLAFSEKPVLTSETLINNKLISKEELDELLSYEEQAGKILAPTCLKKDVLNTLKAARNGLIGEFRPGYEDIRRAEENNRERAILDIL